MRSVIEEIAQAEQQAEEIRQNAAALARELTQKAKQDAVESLASLESDERAALASALETAKQQGERISKELLADMEQEADAVCNAASAKLDQAVSYLLDKVTKTA